MTSAPVIAALLQIATLDSTAANAAETSTGVAAQAPIEQVMLAGDKMPVVLAVVLIVWAALLFLVVRTDRRLARVERDLDAREAALRDSTF